LQGDTLEDHISAPQQILLNFLENHFPLSAADPKGGNPKMSDREINNLHAQVPPPPSPPTNIHFVGS